jgi:hypothetical protein
MRYEHIALIMSAALRAITHAESHQSGSSARLGGLDRFQRAGQLRRPQRRP